MNKKGTSSINLEQVLSTDNFQDFLRLTRQLPSADMKENFELISLAQAGDANAREELILKNLRLVSSSLLKKSYRPKNCDKLDMLQEGILTLIESIDKFDAKKGTAFSTYATSNIENKFKSIISNYDHIINRPSDYTTDKNQYRNLKEDCARRGIPLPSDDEIAAEFHISKETLQIIRTEDWLNPISLDAPIQKEDDETYLPHIESYERGYANIEDRIYQSEIFAFLKWHLDSFEYFVLYYRFLKNNPCTLSELAERLHVKPQYINQKENAVLQKAAGFYDSSSNFIGHLTEEQRNIVHRGSFRFEPMTPEKIVRFLFIRDILSPIERNFIMNTVFTNIIYSSLELADILGIQPHELDAIERNLENKLQSYFEENENLYKLFYENILSHYKSQIFKLELTSDIGDFLYKDYTCIREMWEGKSYDDVVIFANRSDISIDAELDRKLREYFGDTQPISTNKLRLEKKLNYLRAGFHKRSDIPRPKLWKTFKTNKDDFTPEQSLALSYMFGKISLEEARAICPTFDYSGDANARGYDKLLAMHFHLFPYRSLKLDKKRYLFIKDHMKDSTSAHLFPMLDLHFGIKKRPFDLEKMAAYLKTDVSTAASMIKAAKEELIDNYLGISSGRPSIDLEAYPECWHDSHIEFKEPQNTIMHLFIEEGKTREEIISTTGLKPSKVSALISDGLFKLDMYRFDLSGESSYTVKELLTTLKISQMDEKLKLALRDLLAGQDEKNVSDIHSIPIQKIRAGLSNLKTATKTRLVAHIELTSKEIAAEIEAPEYANILPARARKILSLIFGIKNSHNPEGLTLNNVETASMLGINKKTVSDYKNLYLANLKAKKAGILKAELDVLTKDEICIITSDRHIPISPKERETLELFYGLAGHKTHTIEEICATLKLDADTVRYRIRHAAITIKKYMCGEIKRTISFEDDVEPYLKYFTYSDRLIITSLLREKMTIESLATQQGWSHDRTLNHAHKLKLYLKELQDGRTPGLDFDMFYATVDDETVPFYGDKPLAKHLFDLYYEKDLSYKGIQRTHYPNMSEDSIKNNIFQLIVAVMKRQIYGIKKTPDYSYEEIRDYFLRHQETMSLTDKAKYCQYFSNYKTVVVPTRPRTPKFIASDLLREKDGYITLTPKDKDQILKELIKHKNAFSRQEIYSICSFVGLSTRACMKGSDKKQVLDFFMDLNVTQDKHLTMTPIDN